MARSLIFDLSSLTTSLLAGECSSSCALNFSSFLSPFPTEDTPLHWFQRLNIQAASPFQHIVRCNIVWVHAATSKRHSIDSLVRQRRKISFKISKSAKATFRFPTTSEWLLPETTLHFLKSHSSLVNFSPSQSHHYRSFNDTFCTFSCYLNALPLLFPFLCLTFPHRRHNTFLIYATAQRNFPQQPASYTPLAFQVVPQPWLLLCTFNCCSHSLLRLSYCFCKFSVFVCFVLVGIPCVFWVSVLVKLSKLSSPEVSSLFTISYHLGTPYCQRVPLLLEQCSLTGFPRNMKCRSVSFNVSVRVRRFSGELISCFSMLTRHYEFF